MGFFKDMSPQDVVSIALSLTAASASVYMLLKPVSSLDGEPRASTSSKQKGPPTTKAEKRMSQRARRAQIETMIMERGEHGTKDFRVHVLARGAGDQTVAELSLWHDVPLVAPSPSETTKGNPSELFNFICEIPKCTRKKFEVATTEGATPIKQDEKKGVLRDYKHGDMLFNYGFMPQTWEDPGHVSEDTGYKGDDDPLDMVEVGCRQMTSGEVAEVKVIGCLAMIDDGETDWKVFCIRVDDPLAHLINDVADLNRELPNAVSTMREWFRTYKLAEGKPLNAFALDEKCMDKGYTEKVIEETHGMWRDAEQELRKLSAPKSPLTPAM